MIKNYSMVKLMLAVFLLGIAWFAACTSPAPVPTTPAAAATSVTTKFDASYGAAPTAGWKWGVAEITTGAEERTEDTNSHGFAWIFYVLRGSIEVGTAEGKKMIPAGGAVIVPAGQDHTHRFLPQSQALVFRPADRPFGEFHRGNRLFESEAPLDLKAGQEYKVRIREFTLPPKSESMTVEVNFGYVAEGTLTVRAGDAASPQPAGKAFGFPPKARQVVSNEGTAPAKFILVDLH